MLGLWRLWFGEGPDGLVTLPAFALLVALTLAALALWHRQHAEQERRILIEPLSDWEMCEAALRGDEEGA